jgi:XRE family transcriptional regulator, regulator of sulfur utilization
MPWPDAWYSRQSLPVPSAKKISPKSTDIVRATSFDPEVARAFGVVVRAERLKLGMAQDQFALQANIDRSYFGKLERGQRQPSLVIMLRVAHGLGCSGAQLMARVEQAMLARGDRLEKNSPLLDAICTPSQRSLYRHFSQNAALVLRLEKAVHDNTLPAWREHPEQVLKIRHAVRFALSSHIHLEAGLAVQEGEAKLAKPLDLEAQTEWVMRLVIQSGDY